MSTAPAATASTRDPDQPRDRRRHAGAAAAAPTRERIQSAAREWLFQHGVEGLTTDRLARMAGVSKTSIYKHFPDQSALVQAVIAEEAATLSLGVPREPSSAAVFWAGLREYGLNLLRLLNRADVIRLDRLMHEQARMHPGLGQRFFEQTYGRTLRELEAMLAYARERGYVRSTIDPRMDAELLLSMWEGMSFTKARLGLTQRPFPQPAAWVEACLSRLFGDDIG